MRLAAALAALSLLAGLSGGLARFGWPLPAGLAPALQHHGAVLVCGFFGSLVALERAVALRRPWGLAAPLLAGSGAVLLVAWSAVAAAVAWTASAAVLVALYVHAGRTRAWSLHLAVELAAALAWGAGTLAWATGGVGAATMAWMAFLVGTIAAERRELMVFVRLPRGARLAFVAIAGLGGLAVLAALAGAPRSAAWSAWWLTCAALAVWLLAFDIAPRQAGKPGWAGHTAICLSAGYGWLAAAALLGLVQALGLSRPDGAAALAPHAVLLGFVFAMVFGHAPIILPALARLRPAHTPRALWPLWVMAASLLLRGLGLELHSTPLLALAGGGHLLAIASFAAVMALAVRRGRS